MFRTAILAASLLAAAPAWAGDVTLSAEEYLGGPMTKAECTNFLSRVRQTMRETVEAGGNVGDSFTIPLEYCEAKFPAIYKRYVTDTR